MRQKQLTFQQDIDVQGVCGATPCSTSSNEIKQLSTDIDKATTAVINAKLSLESSIRQTQREEGVLGAAVNTISDKVDTINKHIAQVMEDAPTKLKLTVTVCDTDWQRIQEAEDVSIVCHIWLLYYMEKGSIYSYPRRVKHFLSFW